MPKPLRDNPPDASNVAPKTIEIKAPRTQGRRQFSAAEKLRIVRAADACAHGELGALLRREGIYHTQLSDWRAAIESGLASRKPGPAPKRDAKDAQIAALHAQLAKLLKELDIVNGLVEIQKKFHALCNPLLDARS